MIIVLLNIHQLIGFGDTYNAVLPKKARIKSNTFGVIINRKNKNYDNM